ncbi:MAG TPA: GNAT family N-acetyltransferase [Anaerolineales bacterium]|nr:GNAT family N-acetyltransferase [Anaerolineales bacterium]
MSSISVPLNSDKHPNIRPMSMFRDLPAVADLIELCFADSMDRDGRRYIADMRSASRDNSFLKWASGMTETASLPLTGFVWEEDDRIIGNASVIPFRDKGRRIYLIANIAVHPDYRRRGIGRILTQRAMQHGWSKKTSALWLHVRDDNPGAIQLYSDLGFQEMAHRTTWIAKPDSLLPQPTTDIQIVTRHPRFWTQQQDWLRRLNPDVLSWYHPININSLRPGLLNWLYLMFIDMDIKQWAAVQNDKLLATLAWTMASGRSDSLIGATPPQGQVESSTDALAQLLIHARRVLARRATLSLEYPGGEMREAFISAGFTERRTLLWMRAEPATQRRSLRS